MPKYFADYDTTVHFISQEELNEKHSGIPHGGFVIRTGVTGKDLEHHHAVSYTHLDVYKRQGLPSLPHHWAGW